MRVEGSHKNKPLTQLREDPMTRSEKAKKGKQAGSVRETKTGGNSFHSVSPVKIS